MQRGCVAMAIRQIPFKILHLPGARAAAVVSELRGAPAGSDAGDRADRLGQVDHAGGDDRQDQQERKRHIITVEDPIEFIHRHKKCIVNQREVGADTKSFAAALKYVLRQDPDVILVGEMRDLETIAAALTIAETGHLVLATLHTNSAAESINRIVDVFPPDQQHQVRAQLAFVLEGVITQQLSRGARARAASWRRDHGVHAGHPALIRDDKVHQIYCRCRPARSSACRR